MQHLESKLSQTQNISPGAVPMHLFLMACENGCDVVAMRARAPLPTPCSVPRSFPASFKLVVEHEGARCCVPRSSYAGVVRALRVCVRVCVPRMRARRL